MNKFLTYILLSFTILWAINLHAGEEDTLNIIGKEAPKFCLPEFNTNQLTCLRHFCGEELKDPEVNKIKYPVILSFFAYWCKPCRKEIPILQNLQHQYADSIKIFLISSDSKKDKYNLSKFIEELEITLPVLWDKYGVVTKNYDVKVLPTLFLINRNGKIFFVKMGMSENFSEIIEGKIKKIILDNPSN